MTSDSFSKKTVQQGFTLAELLVVIAVIGLLSSIIFTIASGAREQGQIAKGLYFSQHLQNSLGSYATGIWNFDEGSGNVVNDTSGWENNGSLVNSPTWRCATADPNHTPSGQGCSLEFNGSSQYINAGNDNSLNMASITVEAWVKTFVSPPIDWSTIAAKGYQSANNHFWLMYRNGYFGLEYGNGTSRTTASHTITPRQDTWYHIVGTYANGSGYVYVNGVRGAERTAISGDLGTNTYILTMGRASYTPNYYWNGLIDEVHIYSTALTSAQIQSQYYAGLKKLLAKNLITEQEYQHTNSVW